MTFALFVAALASRGLETMVGSVTTAWLARNRSSLCLGFAFSHLIHAGSIVLFFTFTPADFSWSAADVSGVIALPLIALLLFSETEIGAKTLGVWRARVETAIVTYPWVQFLGFFIDRLTYGRPELHPPGTSPRSASATPRRSSACAAVVSLCRKATPGARSARGPEDSRPNRTANADA